MQLLLQYIFSGILWIKYKKCLENICTASKIEALQNINRPTDQKVVQSFLRLYNYLDSYQVIVLSRTHSLTLLLTHSLRNGGFCVSLVEDKYAPNEDK